MQWCGENIKVIVFELAVFLGHLITMTNCKHSSSLPKATRITVDITTHCGNPWWTLSLKSLRSSIFAIFPPLSPCIQLLWKKGIFLQQSKGVSIGLWQVNNTQVRKVAKTLPLGVPLYLHPLCLICLFHYSCHYPDIILSFSLQFTCFWAIIKVRVENHTWLFQKNEYFLVHCLQDCQTI